MLKALFLNLLFFTISISAFARVELQTSQGTNTAGTQTYVQVTTYYDDQGTEKKDTPVCLLIKDGTISNAQDSKNCLTSSHSKFVPFKTDKVSRVNESTPKAGVLSFSDAVIEEKKVNFPRNLAGKYDAEKLFAHLDAKGNLVIVEQSAAVPLDENKNPSRGVVTNTITVTQPVDPKLANSDGTLPQYTTFPPQNKTGNAPALVAPLTTPSEAEKKSLSSIADARKSFDSLDFKFDSDPLQTTGTLPDAVLSSSSDLASGPVTHTPAAGQKVSNPESCAVNAKDSQKFCEKLQTDDCFLKSPFLLSDVCDSNCENVPKCAAAYEEMKAIDSFKTILAKIKIAEKAVAEARTNNSDELPVLRKKLKSLVIKLDGMVNERGSKKPDTDKCTPTNATFSNKRFFKVDIAEGVLKAHKCSEVPDQRKVKAPAAKALTTDSADNCPMNEGETIVEWGKRCNSSPQSAPNHPRSTH